jgi:ATP-dependent DNA helicase RecQ
MTACLIINRGESFREVFLRVVELRILVPPNVPVLAITATISPSSRECIQEVLGMHSPKLVVMSPSKPNMFNTLTKCDSVDEVFSPILDEILTLKLTFPRTIIFCRLMNECLDIYLFLKNGLGRDFLEPTNAPNLSQYRLVEMFHKHTDPDVKVNIIPSFTITATHVQQLLVLD